MRQLNTGSTLIETIITMAIFFLIFAMSVAAFINFQKKGQLEDYLRQITATLRETRAKASAGNVQGEDVLYFGVVFEEDSFLQFATPNNFANKIDEQDLETDLPGGLSFDSINMPNDCIETNDCIVFSAIEASASGSGSVIIQSKDGEERTININSLGKVSSD